MRTCFAAILALVPTVAVASPLNPWGAPVGSGATAVTPFLYVDSTPAVYPLAYVQYGISDPVEILAGVGATLGGASSFDTIELMPRYFFEESTGMALHVLWTVGDSVAIGPELHGVYTVGPVDLTVNAGWTPSIGPDGFSAGEIAAIVAPEWYFNEASSLFLEIDPSWDVEDYVGADVERLSLELVPGVSTSIAETHYIAVGVAVPVLTVGDLGERAPFSPGNIYLGAWYSIGFGGE